MDEKMTLSEVVDWLEDQGFDTDVQDAFKGNKGGLGQKQLLNTSNCCL